MTKNDNLILIIHKIRLNKSKLKNLIYVYIFISDLKSKANCGVRILTRANFYFLVKR